MGKQLPLSHRAALCLLVLASFGASGAEDEGGRAPPKPKAPTQAQPAVEEPVATIMDAPIEIVSTARLPQEPVLPSLVPAAVQVIGSEELSTAFQSSRSCPETSKRIAWMTSSASSPAFAAGESFRTAMSEIDRWY